MNNISLYDKKWVLGDYEPHARAYYYKTWHGFQMPYLHKHQAIEIMYVLKNQCIVEVGDEEIHLKKGDFILIDGGVEHRLIVEKDTSCRMLNIEFMFKPMESGHISLRQMIDFDEDLKGFIDEGQSYIVLKDVIDLQYTLTRLIREHDRGTNTLMVSTLYFELLVYIARVWKMTNDGRSEIKAGHHYVTAAKDYILSHYDESIHIHKIAGGLSINENYLQRLFKDYTGETLVAYINSVRMEKAKMLLENTQLSLMEICDYTGINSRQYLTKLFKVHYGMSPSAYRTKFTISE